MSKRLEKRDRDAKGRLLPGHKLGGPGNPLVGKMMRFKRALLEATSPTQAQRIFRKLAKLAEGGDLRAIKLYLEYTIGRSQHGYDPRQGLPPEAEQRAGYKPTPAECRVLAQELLDRADRADGVIEADGEEVSGG